jgi:hypothetical protein
MDRVRGRASGISRWGEGNWWFFGLSDIWLSDATLRVQMILCIGEHRYRFFSRVLDFDSVVCPP